MSAGRVHGGYTATAHARFRGWLSRRFGRFTVAGLVIDDAPVALWQIYVPLLLTAAPFEDDATEESLAAGRTIDAWIADPAPRDAGSGVREPREPYGDASARAARVVLVSGPAGSGKTTLTSSIAATVARGGDGPLARRFGRWLPVPIILRDHDLDRADSLDALVSLVFAEAKTLDPELDLDLLRRYLDHGEALLMLDGLDEVGSLERRRKVIGWLLGHRWVTGDGELPGCAVMVTARPSGFDGLDDALRPLGALRLHVAPFSWAQVETFLKKWFALRPITDDERRESTSALLRRLKEEPEMSELRRLARRPAYLTALAFVHGTRGALPHSRVVLFEQIVDAYVDVLDRHRRLLSARLGERVPFWDHDEKRTVLAEFAWRAQCGHWAAEERGEAAEERRLRWTRAVMAREVEGIIARRASAWRTLKVDDGAALADYFLQRTGLFAEVREGEIQFGHLVFQEFLAALYVVERAGAARDKGAYLEKHLLAPLEKPGWVEVARLALALDDRRTAGLGHRALLPLLDLRQPGVALLACHLALSEEIQWEAWERRAWRLLCLLATMEPGGHPYATLAATIARDDATMVDAAVRHLADEGELRPAIQRAIDDATEEGKAALCGQEDEDYPTALVARARALPFDADAAKWCAFELLKPVSSDPRVGELVIARLSHLRAAPPRASSPAPPLPRFWVAISVVNASLAIVRAVAAASRLAWMAADLTGWFIGTVFCAWWAALRQEDQPDALVLWRARVHAEVRAAMRWAIVARSTTQSTREGTGLHDVYMVAQRHHREWLRLNPTVGLDDLFSGVSNLFVRRDETMKVLAPSEGAGAKLALWWGVPWDHNPNTVELLVMLLELPASLQIAAENRRVHLSRDEGEPLHDLIFADAYLRGSRHDHTTRAELVALRARFLDPDAMVASLTSPADRDAARAEWCELLESPASPIPCLDLALATSWDQLTLDPAEMRRRFEAHYKLLLG